MKTKQPMPKKKRSSAATAPQGSVPAFFGDTPRPGAAKSAPHAGKRKAAAASPAPHHKRSEREEPKRAADQDRPQVRTAKKPFESAAPSSAAAKPAPRKSAAAAPYEKGKRSEGYVAKAALGDSPRTPKKASFEPKGAPHQPAATRVKAPAKGPASPKARTVAGRRAQEGTFLKGGQTVELTIVGLNHDGFGVANFEGNRILVAHTLPGEHLVARITYVGRREAFGSMIKCLKPSPDRVENPACSKLHVCDGCGLMQMRYPAQTAWKKDLVQKELRRYPSQSEVRVCDTIASPQELGYRNSAKLVVSGKNADPVIGMYRRNSHEVLQNLSCPLHHPLINKVIRAAKDGIRKGKVPIYNPKSEMGLLRYLVVRVSQPDNQVMVVLVTTELGYNEMHHLAKHIQKEVPEVRVVAQNINNTTGNVIFGGRDRFLTKTQTLRTQIGDTLFQLSPRSFLQVNTGAADIIYEKVRELAALNGTERVIDVYCGIGGISLLLAKEAREVVGIELVESAVADAVLNAALNRVDNCHFEAGDAVHLLDEIGGEGGADLIVLNPPRKGCDEKVLRHAAALKPQKMIYVSCSPETLARDLDVLSGLGYRTVQVHPVDMFPQTVHVEDIALLERQAP